MGEAFFALSLLGIIGFALWPEKIRPTKKPEPAQIVENEMAKRVVKKRKKPVQISAVHRSEQLPDWFCVKGLEPSPAERLIITELDKYRVKWYREVAFENFPSSKYGYYRYDFMLPALRLVIEYDGKAWHQHPDRQKIDGLKNRFCTDNGITVKRYSSKDYYKMEGRIAELMRNYGVSLA